MSPVSFVYKQLKLIWTVFILRKNLIKAIADRRWLVFNRCFSHRRQMSCTVPFPSLHRICFGRFVLPLKLLYFPRFFAFCCYLPALEMVFLPPRISVWEQVVWWYSHHMAVATYKNVGGSDLFCHWKTNSWQEICRTYVQAHTVQPKGLRLCQV